MASEENQRLLLTQARESERHQDKLRWSRVQTASLIEGAMLAALYSGEPLGTTRHVFIVVAGSLLVFMVCMLAIKDGRDARNHRNVATDLEKELGAEPWKSQDACFTGRHILWAIIVLVNGFNLAVFIDQLRPLLCP